jgi:hypothetical protein
MFAGGSTPKQKTMNYIRKSVSSLAATLITIGTLAGGRAQAANVFTTFTMPATTTNIG